MCAMTNDTLHRVLSDARSIGDGRGKVYRRESIVKSSVLQHGAKGAAVARWQNSKG